MVKKASATPRPKSSPPPPCPPPSYQQFYHCTITSPDSAPGADGIPYSAWRVCPSATASSLQSHFHDIIYRQASPPLQSLVFIPKADQGDYADNYRPLGLPNTSDRILDRSAYSPFCSALMGALRPAQALLNAFREPQFNYLEVQRFLDDTSNLHSVLLSDLAKAFERVNPHWIMHVLITLKVPYWVLCYCRHILFGRRVLHKIKSTFRPPLAIHTGVDMGRAFSVLLFCVAMDPWYYHVHKIPRVLVNKGYMDDNATGGAGLKWLARAERLINSFASAGFVVLMHACYHTEILPSADPSSSLISSCASVTTGYPSLFSSLPSPIPNAWLRLKSGSRAITIHSSQLSISSLGVRCPSHPQLLSFLHTAPCNCKCKTFLLPNFTLSEDDLILLDSTPFGAKILAAHATMLGLFLHSPTSRVAPCYNDQGDLISPLLSRPAPDIETSQSRKALATMDHRARAVSALSFRERTLFLSFYVMSIPLYIHSTLLPSPDLLSQYTRILPKVLCPRPWMKAAFLPGVVTFIKLGILHCPQISTFSSLVGYCLRCYGEPVLTWLCFIVPTLPLMPKQLTLGLQHVRQILLQADPYSVTSFIPTFQKFLYQGLPPHKLAPKITQLLKAHLRRRLLIDARTFLRRRLAQVPWLFSSSSAIFDTLHVTPLKVVPSFLRLALLRWAIDSEPDLHFRLRPHLSRSAPCVCGCGEWCSLPCVLCGHGDNSVQHWLFFCPIPACAGSLLLKKVWKTQYWFFSLSSSFSQRAIICGLWGATRQFVHERSGLPPPSLHLPSTSASPPSNLHTLLAQRASSLIPTPFRPHHLPLSSVPFSPTRCTFAHILFQTLTLEHEGHPHFHGPAPVSAAAFPVNSLLGVIPSSSPLISQLFRFQHTFARVPNCTLSFKPCACGAIHGYITTLLPLSKHSPIHIGDPPTHTSDFILQFDGGAFRELKLGGAGVILWKHQQGALEHIDSLCIPLYPCADAAYAEASGAAHAVLLAAKHYLHHSPSQLLIKGDNRAVIDFMTSQGKYRRPDLQQLLEEAQHVIAFSLPPILWSYTPREFNRCADFLAGIARDFVTEHFSHAPTLLAASLTPFFFPLPPSLHHFSSSSQFLTPLSLSTPTFILPEIPALPLRYFPALYLHYQRSPPILRYLRALTGPSALMLRDLSVSYRPSASDHKGRLYPVQLGAAKLPKLLRTLLFGATHIEVDLVGSHYQLFQRFHLACGDTALPTVQQLRRLLSDDMSIPPCTLLTHRPKAPKDLPTHLLNSTLDQTLEYYRQYGYYPSPQVRQALQRINGAKPSVFAHINALFGERTLDSLSPRNMAFHILEHPETLWLRHFVIYMHRHHTFTSVIWLHDGVWLSPPPVFSDITRGTPPPARDEEFSLGAPRPQLQPPLQEPTARAALLRMMDRSALPPECIIVDD